MSLKKIKQALVMELGKKSNMDLFQKTKRHYKALAYHETAMSVLALLSKESPRHWEEKDNLVRALIKVSQTHPHSYWRTLLTIAFYPMLSRLRGRITGNALSRDDLDQLVLSSFLEVVEKFSLNEKPDRTCMHLRQMTKNLVFRRLKQEQDAQAFVRSADSKELDIREIEIADEFYNGNQEGEHHLRWPETKTSKSWPPSEKEQSQLVAFLVDKVGDDVDGDHLNLIIATQIYGQKLSDHVRDSYPDLSSGDRKKTYQRIKRRHSRTLVKLRELLCDLHCPQTDPSGPLPLRSA